MIREKRSNPLAPSLKIFFENFAIKQKQVKAKLPAENSDDDFSKKYVIFKKFLFLH